MIPFSLHVLISAIALLVAVAVGLFPAIYLSNTPTNTFAVWSSRYWNAGRCATVVYVFFRCIDCGALHRQFCRNAGMNASSQKCLGGPVLVMGINDYSFVSLPLSDLRD